MQTVVDCFNAWTIAALPELSHALSPVWRQGIISINWLLPTEPEMEHKMKAFIFGK